jgi:hypothetical protein
MRKFSVFRAAMLPMVLLLGATTGQAALLTFTYLEAPGGPTLSGTISGDLQLDGNTFIATSMGPVYLDNVLAPDVPFVHSMDFINTMVAFDIPIVTLDGSFMDLVACSTDACDGDAFAFAAGNKIAIVAGFPIFVGGETFGNDFQAFDASAWTASVDGVPTGGAPPTETVPEPGTLALGCSAGVALLAWKKRSVVR